MQNLVALIQSEFSGARAFEYVSEVCQHHRIQCSPGYRDAAKYCQDIFTKSGVASSIVSYPSDFGTKYWTQMMWEEWVCQEAKLDLIQPSKLNLADFSAIPMSIIQRSYSTPSEGIDAPIICLNNGDNEEDYPGINFTGAIVFTGGDLQTVRRWAIEKRGAIGIISDRMAEFLPVRHRYDIPDALQYTSFWPAKNDKPCFGFVLSPKGGDALRQICQKQAKEHQLDPQQPLYPQAHAFVSAQFYPGAIENVEAFIPGLTNEEIVLTAHLCHPQASANDNASGVGTLLETARVLQKLITTGALPKPKRGIRFLLVPEMTGTYAWLSQNEAKIPQVKAGLNLDMVGENQDLCKGPLVVEYPPQASKSFVGDLAAACLDAIAGEAYNLGGTAKYALFKYTTAPFSGGSDHYIMSDPTVGIPSPMLIQWPDKFYHTSADTLDKVDPQMLYRVGCLSAAYAWLTATIGADDVDWLFAELRSRYLRELGDFLKQDETKAPSEHQLKHLLSLRKEQFASLSSFIESDKQADFALKLEHQQQLLDNLTTMLWAEHACKEAACTCYENADPQMQQVPKRLFRGPFSNRGWVETLPAEEQVAFYDFQKQYGRAIGRSATVLVYWIDGKRNMQEICNLVQLETGSVDPEACLAYLQWLTRFGLIEWLS